MRRWGCREGGGAGRDAGVEGGLQGSVFPTPTSLCRRDGLCIGVGGWTVWVGPVCSVGPLKVESCPPAPV